MAAPGTEPGAGPSGASDPPPTSSTTTSTVPAEISGPRDSAEQTKPTTSTTLTDGALPPKQQNTPPESSADKPPPSQPPQEAPPPPMAVELDEFGLPVRPVRQYTPPSSSPSESGRPENQPRSHRGSVSSWFPRRASRASSRDPGPTSAPPPAGVETLPTVSKNESSKKGQDGDNDDDFKDAVSRQSNDTTSDGPLTPVPPQTQSQPGERGQDKPDTQPAPQAGAGDAENDKTRPRGDTVTSNTDGATKAVVSEFSHQQVVTKTEEKHAEDDDDGWQEMPAYARYDMYDDDDRLIAREHNEEEDEKYGYSGLGGAGKGYTRVIMDDDAESATSMDENTQYLFKDPKTTSMMDDDDEQRDTVSQMQATKDLLTEGQRIAYVGIARLELVAMVKEHEALEQTRGTKKLVGIAAESAKMFSQKMMIRLYAHMDISPAEQVMIEQLAEHGVMPSDLTPILMANARVNNPMAEKEKSPGSAGSRSSLSPSTPVTPNQETPAEPPPPYETHEGEDMPDVMTPSQLPVSSKLDIDLRWTVLCDLFLVLVADSNYDARSRYLLERVGKAMEIPWIDICRFEKRVTDALEIQQAAEKENWNEDEHMEDRRKRALKRRYMMMGLATVGGGLVIGLSAGLLAPVIGAGLAAGFTTIGVTGTSGFLAGAGGAAVITSSAAASGSFIGVRAANRRTGAVRTFEYRPLHNNKRVNLIITVSGWMTGKVDDVRLPFSTVDSVMGDIYSVLWEPELLRSMGDTINILATEALTQGLQQVLGSTILMALMAAIQVPVILTKLSYLIDNPWAVSLDRATAAGLILADSLIDRNLGTRPVTLVGYSLGSRVIFSCLQELARKGAHGVVQNVYLFGSPIVVKKDEYIRARTVVPGRFVNGYNRNDWILGYLFRLTSGGIRRVAGLVPLEEVPWVENVDVSELVAGHMEYRAAMPRLLRECGWLVESDEFTEIEDPDPDNHGERQRELISEIEAARRELEKEGKAANGSGKGGAFSFFRKKKALEKAEWEVYGDTTKAADKEKGWKGSEEDVNRGVLFDVDAIRAELAKEKLEIRELQSTLPPMKLDLRPAEPPADGDNRVVDVRVRTPELEVKRASGDAGSLRPSQERTPTLPRDRELAASPYFQEYSEPQEEIQMTFDSFDERREPSPPPPAPARRDEEPSRDQLQAYHTPKEEIPSPGLPTIAIADPWADPDHEDFGKEKEIQMTFA